ncbi:MAG: class C sortase [Lachnospiraceae bacterium]|nr:class C sortase [Lachnospiraceae bacterium]
MKKLTPIIAIILILIGVGIFAYPWISSMWNTRQSKDLVEQYERDSVNLTDTEVNEQLLLAMEYNRRVSGLAPYDPFSEKEPVPFPDYGEILVAGNTGVMATLEVPSIDLSLPIYHGVSDEVLEIGIGHMPTTALPVGGEGTHCVLVGHNAIPSRVLFTHLDRVEVGDAIIIHVLGIRLGYRVDQIMVVVPEETKPLLPVVGEDYISLVTCTPYGINSHRLFVRGIRDDSVLDEEGTKGIIKINLTLLIAGLLTALAMGIIITIVAVVRHRRRTYIKIK